MGFYPRKRAKSIIAKVRRWPKISEVKLLGFAAYKVGMAHMVMTEDYKYSPLYGKEVVKPVTILEAPPLVVIGVRLYAETPYGKIALKEIWCKEVLNPDFRKEIEEKIKEAAKKRREGKKEEAKKIIEELGYKIVFLDITRKVPLPKRIEKDFEKTYNKLLEEFKKYSEKASEVRLIVSTQPRRSGIRKKTPEIFEIPVGGDVSKALEYALNKLGKEVSIEEVFKAGEFVDVISITKGKGTAGVVKRFHVKILPRWHKHRKGHRRIGSIGPTGPAVMFTTPRIGQLGYQQRTEYNKRILMIGSDLNFINPSSGFKHYGVVRSTYLIVEGSVPGPPKRLVKLRYPIRPKKSINFYEGLKLTAIVLGDEVKEVR